MFKLFTLPLFVLQLSKKPLAAVEFVAPLARIDPIYKEEEEAFKVRISHLGHKTWNSMTVTVLPSS